VTIGVLAYGVALYPHTLAAAFVTFVVGVACFAALGCLLAALSPNANATPPMAAATLVPLAFISEVFIPPSAAAASWLAAVADFFPLKHFARAFSGAFNPTLHGHGFAWSDAGGTYAILPHLAVMAIWGIGGGLLALRLFRWEPRPEQSR
jgi:ABC-2 type transport system permease protein